MTLASSKPFQYLVSALKRSNKTCTVVEQCCGGMIQSSIMAQPGASSVFLGGSVSYNTRRSKPLLLNDQDLYDSLTKIPPPKSAEDYIQSKLAWTAKTSIAFCKTVGTDIAIAEGGASGPTFRPDDMKTGFAVIAVAGRANNGSVQVLGQEVIRSHTANREENMVLFANAAARLAAKVVSEEGTLEESSTTLDQPNHATALRMDRATHLRSNTTALEASAKYIILQGKNIMARETENGDIHLGMMTAEDVRQLPHNHRRTFLGMLPNEVAVFGVDLEDDIDSRLATGSKFVDTRTTAPLFNQLEKELALHATAYAQWQRRTKFCSLCGGPTTFIESGTCCECTKCKTHSWPRQDPSMICVIRSRDNERILLAHSARHPPKLHTVLAGFVEAGETFEAAVAREAWEETGISIDEGSVSYIGSQPWPFPQSCMVGFSAVADDQQPLQIDERELVTASWFSRDTVLKAASLEGAMMQDSIARAALEQDPSLELLIPPRGVIARKLIDGWLLGAT